LVELFEMRLKGHRDAESGCESMRRCDAECDEVECKTENATMLEEGTKHDKTRRHDNEFDKMARWIRVDVFKKNADGHAQECMQLAFRMRRAALDCVNRLMCTVVGRIPLVRGTRQRGTRRSYLLARRPGNSQRKRKLPYCRSGKRE
jgi:hypothetical protein